MAKHLEHCFSEVEIWRQGTSGAAGKWGSRRQWGTVKCACGRRQMWRAVKSQELVDLWI